MPRIRSIHPGLFTDEAYMALSLAAMAAWPGIWTQADDNGVFEWKPLTLKARLLPSTSVNMIDLLAEYEAQGLVRRFEADGHSYGAVRNFLKYQHCRRPSPAHPLPPDAAAYLGGNPTLVATSSAQQPVKPVAVRTMSGSSTPKSGKSRQRSEIRDKRSEIRDKNTHTTEHRPAPAREAAPGGCVKDSALEEKPPSAKTEHAELLSSSRADFDTVAKVWPNREAVEAAWPVYRAALAADPDAAVDIEAGAQAFVDRLDEKYDGDSVKLSRFCPQLRNWLRDRRWLDEDTHQEPWWKSLPLPGERPGLVFDDGLPPDPLRKPPTPEEVDAVSRMMADMRASVPTPAPRRRLLPLAIIEIVEETPEEQAEFEAMKAAALAELRADMAAVAP